MKQQIQKLKLHLKEHKTVYISGGVCLLMGALGGAVVASRKGAVSGTINQVLSYKPEAHLDIFIEALGDPGNIIQDDATGTVYASQSQAAKALGIHPARIGEQLNGKRDHVNGHTFTKLGKAQVA